VTTALKTRIENPDVAAVFETYPEPVRGALQSLRSLILDTAADLDGVGEIEEALRWGQPSYLTTKSKSGTMIRIDRVKAAPDRYALYVHCQTSLIETFKARYPDELTYEGNRAVLFDAKAGFPDAVVRHCIQLALTYRLRKQKS
jgi:hypothetical protein